MYTSSTIYFSNDVFICSSSTNDSDDSSEEDFVWNSYRKHVKSQGLSPSANDQQNFNTIVTSDQNTNILTEPLEDVQSWSQMLQDVTPFQQPASSSSELDDTLTGGSPLLNCELEDNSRAIKKVGKKAKVRKHTKKKKTQAVKSEKKGETSKKSNTEKPLEDSKLCSNVKQEDCSTVTLEESTCHISVEVPSNTAMILPQHQDQGEDINKIKMRLEAQINARKGFGFLPSQEVVYDKVCVLECVYHLAYLYNELQ